MHVNIATNFIKFAPGAEDGNLIELLAVPFGGPFGRKGQAYYDPGRDLYGEYFSAKTNLCLDWFPEGRPLLYHHGLDPDAGLVPVGRVLPGVRSADVGHWVQAQLDAGTQYEDGIKELIRQRKLYTSSGAMAHLVDVDKKSGEIKTWPWVEQSLTPTPANLFAKVTEAEARAFFSLAGIKAFEPKRWAVAAAEITATRAELDAEARDKIDTSDFAYVDSDGEKHLPIYDAAHARAALARFNQTAFESEAAKKKAAKKILSRAHGFGIDVADDSAVAKAAKAMLKYLPGGTGPVPFEQVIREVSSRAQAQMGGNDPWDHDTYTYPVATFPDYQIVCCNDHDGDDDDGEYYYAVPYTLGPDGHVASIGTPTRVEQDWVPVAPPMALTREAESALSAVAALHQHTKGLVARRLKEGREIREENRKKIGQHVAGALAHLSGIQTVLDTSDSKHRMSGSADDGDADDAGAAAKAATLERSLLDQALLVLAQDALDSAATP